MSTLPDHEPACLEATAEAVDVVIAGRPRDVGTITVARLLPAARRRMIGPFTFLDHMGPVELSPGIGFDIAPHPHIGLSTVTYFLAGENVHRDSLGSVQVNRPGELNLMTAGRGVVHSERAEPGWRARGGLMHGVQIWLALPVEHEDDAPSFEHHGKDALPAIAPAPGVRGRVLLGSAFGATAPVRHPSQPVLVDLELDGGAAVELPPLGPERGVFLIEGELALGDTTLAADHLAALREGAVVRIAANRPSRLLILGGPALGPRLMDWNFVASTQDRIDRARAAWKAQSFPAIPGDDREFVPYPELRR